MITVPVPAPPVLETPRGFPYPWQSLRTDEYFLALQAKRSFSSCACVVCLEGLRKRGRCHWVSEMMGSDSYTISEFPNCCNNRRKETATAATLVLGTCLPCSVIVLIINDRFLHHCQLNGRLPATVLALPLRVNTDLASRTVIISQVGGLSFTSIIRL